MQYVILLFLCTFVSGVFLTDRRGIRICRQRADVLTEKQRPWGDGDISTAWSRENNMGKMKRLISQLWEFLIHSQWDLFNSFNSFLIHYIYYDYNSGITFSLLFLQIMSSLWTPKPFSTTSLFRMSWSWTAFHAVRGSSTWQEKIWWTHWDGKC